MERIAIIRKEKGKWVVKSHDGKVLGRHPTREKALKQLQAIEISKHKRAVVTALVKSNKIDLAVKIACSLV